MELDYTLIGKRIARRRRQLGLRQVQVCEQAGISDKYLPASSGPLPSPPWKW